MKKTPTAIEKPVAAIGKSTRTGQVADAGKIPQFKIVPGTIVGFISSKDKARVGAGLKIVAQKRKEKVPVGNVTLKEVPTEAKKGLFIRSFKIDGLPSQTPLVITATLPSGLRIIEAVSLERGEGLQLSLSFDE